jgi:hypothetical protein
MAPAMPRKKNQAALAADSTPPPAPSSVVLSGQPPARVPVPAITPERALQRAARKFLPAPLDRCVKCGSTFVGFEPAFVHCHYCGKTARIAGGSLLAQEEYELRSGLRLAP